MDSNKRTMRMMSDEEISLLDTSKDFVTIKLDFGNELDLNKAITYKEYSDFLLTQFKKYDKTALGELLHSLHRVYRKKSEIEHSTKTKPKTTIEVSTCGGCGCEPGAPCYVLPLGWCYSCS